jgi:MSHA type pilus biogenesis protein MshL
MDFHQIAVRLGTQTVSVLIAVALLAGCGTTQLTASPRSAVDTGMAPVSGKQDPFIQDGVKGMEPETAVTTPQPPDYLPVSDDVSPARNRMINIQSRNSTLGDILHVIADAASLNLIIGEGVQQERPITITLRLVSAEEALTTVLTSADYFYTIKDNVLSVDATGTKLFELGHPAMIQGYNVEVGGDILGSGASLSAGGGGGSSNIKGTISQTVKNDTKAFDFWEGLEKSLQSMIGGQLETVTKQIDSSTQSRADLQQYIAGDSKRDIKLTSTSEKIVFPPLSVNKPQQLIILNRLTGTIMVTATRSNLLRIENYLNELRETLSRQVLVEARVIEVQLNDSLKYGIDWSFLGDISGFGQIAGGFGATMTGGLQAAVDGAAPSFRIGAIKNSNNGSLSGLLTALKTQGEVKTLSNPRINVMNGQTALLTVGRNQNYIAKVTSTSSGSGSDKTTTFTVDTANVLSGIMIGLAPIINSKGEISLTVTPIVSDLVGLEDKRIGSDPENQTSISIPTVDLRELSTTVKVRTGELIVIGGLISNKQHLNDEKIPILGDIPWIKGLFTRKDNLDSRTELVVVLQPHIISDK